MEETKKNKFGINLFVVIIAFVFGLTVGQVDFDAMLNKTSGKISRTDATQLSTENLTETTQANVMVNAVTSNEATTTSAVTFKTDFDENSDTVYRTPTGKRYHYNPDCAGVNRIESTVDESTSLGLTPCKKCAGG